MEYWRTQTLDRFSSRDIVCRLGQRRWQGERKTAESPYFLFSFRILHRRVGGTNNNNDDDDERAILPISPQGTPSLSSLLRLRLSPFFLHLFPFYYFTSPFYSPFFLPSHPLSLHLVLKVHRRTFVCFAGRLLLSAAGPAYILFVFYSTHPRLPPSHPSEFTCLSVRFFLSDDD